MKMKNNIYDTIYKEELFTLEEIGSDFMERFILHIGDGSRRRCVTSNKKVYEFIKTKADQGDAHCQIILALMHVNGFKCKKDYKAAMTLLNKASKAGDTDADLVMGRMYCLGLGVETDYVKGISLIGSAYIKNNLITQNYLNRCG